MQLPVLTDNGDHINDLDPSANHLHKELLTDLKKQIIKDKKQNPKVSTIDQNIFDAPSKNTRDFIIKTSVGNIGNNLSTG